MERICLVTGATGFIGANLVAELSRAGHHVRALVRKIPTDKDAQSDVEYVLGDITDPESLSASVKGCAHVYHLAGYAKNWAPDFKTYHDINVQGLRNVLQASSDAGVERVVWTSTFMTVGPTPVGEVCDESYQCPPEKHYTEYERSKIAGEAVAQEWVKRGMSVVTVNPARVFGPGLLTEGNSLAILIDDYDQGRCPILLRGGRDVGCYAYVDDVVQGMMLAMEKGRDGERYILGGENVSLRELLELVDKVSGKKHFKVTIRRPGFMIYAYFQLWRAKLLGIYPRITPPWAKTYMEDWAYSSKKAESELGYSVTPFEQAITATYNWLLEQR